MFPKGFAPLFCALPISVEKEDPIEPGRLAVDSNGVQLFESLSPSTTVPDRCRKTNGRYSPFGAPALFCGIIRHLTSHYFQGVWWF